MGTKLHGVPKRHMWKLDLDRQGQQWHQMPQVRNKGYGKPSNRATGNPTWLESPPGLTKIRPLKKSKVQQEATDLLANSWMALPEDTQTKLQALGIGPGRTGFAGSFEDPHGCIATLPLQVQEIASKLTAPEPITEREIAGKLKGQVTELKNMSIKKNQLQVRIDGVKAQYANLLAERAGADPNGGRILCTQLEHLVGNTYPRDSNQGWTIPVPDDDDRSWEGSEGLFVGGDKIGECF